MIDHIQFRDLVIQPALKGVGLYSLEAEELLMRTLAQESLGGYYLKQTVGGEKAALGPYEMQTETHDDIWNNYLVHNTDLALLVMTVCRYPIKPKAEIMVYNLLYATIMARIFWLHVREEMPAVDDVEQQWFLYKKYWNTVSGKATKQQFIANYDRFIKGD